MLVAAAAAPPLTTSVRPPPPGRASEHPRASQHLCLQLVCRYPKGHNRPGWREHDDNMGVLRWRRCRRRLGSRGTAPQLHHATGFWRTTGVATTLIKASTRLSTTCPQFNHTYNSSVDHSAQHYCRFACYHRMSPTQATVHASLICSIRSNPILKIVESDAADAPAGTAVEHCAAGEATAALTAAAVLACNRRQAAKLGRHTLCWHLRECRWQLTCSQASQQGEHKSHKVPQESGTP